MRNFSKGNGGVRTQLYSIGRTFKGTELWVLKLTAAHEDALGIPNVKLIGNMHGNEPVGREILLHFIEYLINNYKADKTVSWLLKHTKLHILPSLNPDGFARSTEGHCQDNIGRCVEVDPDCTIPEDFVDLNRNFPDYFYDSSGLIFDIPESTALMRWMENTTFSLSAALHGGELVANYPFDSRSPDLPEGFPSRTPDDDVFQYLANTYASNHPTMRDGCNGEGSEMNFTGGITNGAEWYSFERGMGDYNYAFHGCMEITLEISCCKYPKANNLRQLWNENLKPLLKYIIQANLGVTGQIIDHVTGSPVPKAKLTILGRNITFYSSITGEFWRILLPGHYNIQVDVNGYNTRIVEFNITVNKGLYPKLSFLNIFLYNSSLFTTPPPTKVASVRSTTVPVTTTADDGSSFKKILTPSVLIESTSSSYIPTTIYYISCISVIIQYVVQ